MANPKPGKGKPFDGSKPGPGRPPATPETRAFKQIAQEASPSALQFLIDVYKDIKAPLALRITAACRVIERGEGIPTAPPEGSKPITGTFNGTFTIPTANGPRVISPGQDPVKATP